MSQTHYVYIIECKDGTWYTGYTNNVEKRLDMHNEGKGAKYTRGRGPVQLVWQEAFGSKTDALKQEYALKRLTRSKKEQYVMERSDNVYAAAKELSE